MSGPAIERILALAEQVGDLHGKGRLGEAIEFAEEAVQLSRESLGARHAGTAGMMNNLAFLLTKMGDYARAEPLYRESLDIYRETDGPRSPGVATCLNNLGSLRQDVGDYQTARSLYEEALDIRRESLGARSPEVAMTLDNLGGLYEAMRDAASAESCYLEALDIFRGEFGTRHPDYATALNNLAGLHRAMENLASAQALYEEALDITRELFGDAHPDVATTLSGLALIRRDSGDHAAAEPLSREVLEIRRRALGPRHPEVAKSLVNLAVVLMGTGRPEEAFDLMNEAAAIHDRILADVFSFGAERQRLAFLAVLQHDSDGFLSLVHGSFSTDPGRVGKALDLVLRRKSVTAEALAAQRDAVLGGRHPDLVEKLQELNSLRMQIAQRTLAGPGPEGAGEHERVLRAWEREKETLEGELGGAIPELRLEQRLREADRAAVAERLPEDSVLLEFVRFDVFHFAAVPARGDPRWKPARYLAFVVPAGEPDRVSMVDLGEAGVIDELIAEYRDSVTGHGRDRAARGLETNPVDSGETEPQAGAALRAAVFDPIVLSLEGRTRLFLAPDGDLTRLPFEVLPTEDDGRLIDEYTFSYVATGRDVLRFGSPARPGERPLVAAAPNFDLGGAPSEGPLPGRHSRDLDPSTIHFPPLAGTEQEGEGIAALLDVSPWLGEAVLESPLKASRSPRVLHLATHGFFLPDQSPDPQDPGGPNRTGGGGQGPMRGTGMENPLLRSGLALAGANTFLEGRSPPPEAEDGILTAEDVSGLDLLGTELAVLSACETGLGEVHRGEGVFGLRRAFVLAGARTLVMSLWKVPDGPSAELMQAFYANLQEGMPRVDALREAQRTLAEIYPPPWFWGAFICQGDPGPMEV